MVPRGQFFGLLGAHGSGKSVLLETISGFVRPTTGGVLLPGWNGRQEARPVGVVRQWPRLPGESLDANTSMSWAGSPACPTTPSPRGLGPPALGRAHGFRLHPTPAPLLRARAGWLGRNLVQAVAATTPLSYSSSTSLARGSGSTARRDLASLIGDAAAGRTVIMASAHLDAASNRTAPCSACSYVGGARGVTDGDASGERGGDRVGAGIAGQQSRSQR